MSLMQIECRKVRWFVQHGSEGINILHGCVLRGSDPHQTKTLIPDYRFWSLKRTLVPDVPLQVALQSLSQLQSDSSSDPRHLEQAVQLALKCLSFDFVGTSLDESTEDPGNIQVPSSWRPLIEDQSTMQLFLDVYAATKPPLSSTALECLVRAKVGIGAAKRRSYRLKKNARAIISPLVFFFNNLCPPSNCLKESLKGSLWIACA